MWYVFHKTVSKDGKTIEYKLVTERSIKAEAEKARTEYINMTRTAPFSVVVTNRPLRGI